MQITRTIVVLGRDSSGYHLEVAVNVTGDVASHLREVYSNLVWTELVDVLLALLDGRRPGWEVDEGLLSQQPPLWETWTH